jgi:hypothetical protein
MSNVEYMRDVLTVVTAVSLTVSVRTLRIISENSGAVDSGSTRKPGNDVTRTSTLFTLHRYCSSSLKPREESFDLDFDFNFSKKWLIRFLTVITTPAIHSLSYAWMHLSDLTNTTLLFLGNPAPPRFTTT